MFRNFDKRALRSAKSTNCVVSQFAIPSLNSVSVAVDAFCGQVLVFASAKLSFLCCCTNEKLRA